MRGARHEERIGGGADADGEEAAVADRIVDQTQDFVLVADGAVGQEHHLAQQGRRALAGEGDLECGQHFGAAAGAQVADELFRPRERVRIERNRRGIKRRGHRVEFDHVEPVARLQPVERQQQRFARLHDGHALHRARRIDDVRDFAGKPGRDGARGRRRQRHQQCIRLAAFGFGEERSAGRGADIGRPDQLEVACGGHRAIGQRQPEAVSRPLLDAHRMIAA